MRIPQDITVATPAFVAVKELIHTTSSAYAASIAVILVLWDIIIKEVAFFAEVFPHACPTTRTVLLYILFFVAERADNLLDFVAGDLVTVIEMDLERILQQIIKSQYQYRLNDFPLLNRSQQKKKNRIKIQKRNGLEEERRIHPTLASLWQCLQPNTSPQHGAMILNPLV
jgi:hypothetical protein